MPRSSGNVSNPSTSGDRRGSLLLVEDNLVNQKVAVHILTRLGYSVQVACNGLEALDQFRANRFDAILMDCQMPVMDGFEATSAMRSSELPSRRTPIIAVTANGLGEQREKCFAVGMDDFLPKPISSESLQVTLDKWLVPAERN